MAGVVSTLNCRRRAKGHGRQHVSLPPHCGDRTAGRGRAGEGRSLAGRLAFAYITRMIGISITPEAYGGTLPEGADLWPAQPFPGRDGLIRIWLEPKFVDRLRAMRGPGESYSEHPAGGEGEP